MAIEFDVFIARGILTLGCEKEEVCLNTMAKEPYELGFHHRVRHPCKSTPTGKMNRDMQIGNKLNGT